MNTLEIDLQNAPAMLSFRGHKLSRFVCKPFFPIPFFSIPRAAEII